MGGGLADPQIGGSASTKVTEPTSIELMRLIHVNPCRKGSSLRTLRCECSLRRVSEWRLGDKKGATCPSKHFSSSSFHLYNQPQHQFFSLAGKPFGRLTGASHRALRVKLNHINPNYLSKGESLPCIIVIVTDIIAAASIFNFRRSLTLHQTLHTEQTLGERT